MIRKFLILTQLLLILQAASLFAQKYYFRNYSVEQGLPQSSLYCLLQDSGGFIWIGTDGAGVTRFDGHVFETYSRSNGLIDNVVRSLLEDSRGNIWIGTDNGITVYDGFNFRSIGHNEGLKGTSVLKIRESSDNRILAATNDGGLSVIIPGDSIIIRNYTSDDGLTSDFIFDIYEDTSGMIWLAMVGGINIVEIDDSLKLKNIIEADIDFPEIVTFLSLESDENGKMWFGSYGYGLFTSKNLIDSEKVRIEPSDINDQVPGMIVWDIVKRKDGTLLLATDKHGVISCRNDMVSAVYNTTSGLQSNQIIDILDDRDGNLWFASYGQGAMIYPGEKIISYNQDDGIKGLQVLDIHIAGEDIFVATEAGLNKFRKDGNKITNVEYLSQADGLKSSGVNAIEDYQKGQLWLGTTNGVFILNQNRIKPFAGNNSLENKNVYCLTKASNNDLWIGTIGGYGRVFADNLFFMDQEDGLINDEIQAIIEDSKKRIWLATLGGLVRIDGNTYTDFNAEDGLTTLRINSLAEDPKGNILIGTSGGGIFRYEDEKDSQPVSLYAAKGVLGSNIINSLKYLNDTLLIAGNDKGFDLVITSADGTIKKVIHNTLDDGFTGGGNNANAIAVDKDGHVWFGTKTGIVRYNPSKDLNSGVIPQSYITGIKLFYEDVDWKSRDFSTRRFTNLPEKLVLPYNDNHLTFLFTALSYMNPDEMEFSYFLDGQSKEWSPYSNQRDMLFSGLTPGSYTLKVKARNKLGLISPETVYNFVIKPPFWQTAWFLITSAVLFIVILIIIMHLREQKLIKEKVKLEKIVDERTKEVVEQKEEIARQRDVVIYQKKEITDSIQYAERIQKALLPVENILKNNVRDHFILFRPKDIVSGDFYWMAEKSGKLIFTAADCTGHGVPGAFMSMLGVSFLNKIVNEEGVVQPSEILNRLRKEIIVSLKQESGFDTNKDGMDIALCSVDLKNMKLQFAGANNPLTLIRKENSEYAANQVKGDKMPIGFHFSMDDFTNHEIELRPGDAIYMSSDGYEDQFGGPEGKKFMKARLTRLLLENQHLRMAEQKELFSKTLDEWISCPSPKWNASGQIDDVILIGIKV